ncbi:MAG: hypothetical protein ABIS92_17115 [Polyangia bacterium]
MGPKRGGRLGEAMNNSAKNRDELNAAQKEWLRKRDACGIDVTCLTTEAFQRVTR